MGATERLAEEKDVRRERYLLGIRPGSQGGQQQQKPEKCLASTLPGYTAMIALADYAGLYFHFNVKGSTLKAAVEARTVANGGASKGWFAIGFSKTGKMTGSDVVLGNYVPSTNKKLPVGSKPGIGGPQPRPIAYLSVNGSKSGNGTKNGGTGKKGSGAGSGSTNGTKSGNSGNPGSGNVGTGGKRKGGLVGAFNMKSLTMGTYAMADNFKIANASVTVTKNGTVVRFARSGPGGSVPVKYGGLNTLIWSYSSTGATKVFGGHMRHRGNAVVNLACKRDRMREAEFSKALYFHFNVKGSTLRAAVEARTVADGGASKGWFAVGFSKTGKMTGSDVVLGNYIPSTNKKLPVSPNLGSTGGSESSAISTATDNGAESGVTGEEGSGAGSGSTNSTESGNDGGTSSNSSSYPVSNNVGTGGKSNGGLVGAFNMESLTMGTYAMADNFKIANASVTVTKRGTVVRFARSGPGGSVPVKYGGLNTLIWSYSSTGATKVFGGHMRHRLLFHWTVSGSNLNAAIEAKSTSGASGGYVSVGFSSNGKMFPADAVVGINGGSVKAYKLNSYTSYTPSKVLTISQTSLKATSSSLVVKFSRPAKGGLVSINLNGKNNVIWAFGKNKKFETHTPKDRCVKSTLAGYTSAVDLNGKGLMFHWRVSGSTLNAAVEAPSNKGSVSVGFSKSGKMFPSDIATGYSGGSVAAYKLTSYSKFSTSKIKVSSVKSSSAATAFKFTRSGNDGSVSINYAGSNSIIWAYGGSGKKLADHGKNRTRSSSLVVLALFVAAVSCFSNGAGVRGVSAAPVPVAKCFKSTLPGYTNAATLARKGLVLHWKAVNPTTINFALEAKAASGAHKGWISVGFSKAGKMTGSDAVIGNLPRPNVIGPYVMTGIAKSSVTRTKKFAITKTSVVTNPKGTIMRFTRSGPRGTVPVKYAGRNFILWAYSATGKSKALDNHSPLNRGAVIINFGCKV
ncbi:unnamed protein product [Closterium sp. Yama58-4]|nr:unnamed protein product [Closterium sp. Yama58-4]